ncbi:Pimeloyl-ACP methyl ester carboxylesterase [Mucilaginibacter gossypiicola]|uniref:Pimeloyl-ACP methyl ester carboxylesterase n=1 Tax=Mucilaginibacter gossypiicola TaxID=551995 RepID=A0A1H8BCF0_9SPHI|nr:alpha/beta hydrolase [Mucilaginibacter gossypiicola]SEM80555.1 Pimeloyl-ACP methyl ester carboxylesterase [Mucilaginibacter gossypiicola]
MKQSNQSKLSMGRKLIAAFVLSYLLLPPVLSNAQEKIKNVVLVHGAFADGSGWKGVFEILTKKGYHVTAVQIPLTSLKDDVDATTRILDKQDGPVILVGHSWGGVVITEAGMHPKVAGLVYVAAYQPDKGENTLKWAATAPTLPEYGILPPDEKGFVYYDKAKFHAGFAGDLSLAETDFMFASQEPIFGGSFETPVADAAWRTKPAYGIVATEDKSINPEIERNMYKRSNTRTTEIKGSHVVFISHPDAVAKVIIAASEKK